MKEIVVCLLESRVVVSCVISRLDKRIHLSLHVLAYNLLTGLRIVLPISKH